MTKDHFIREWRKYRDLTQERLAGRIGCSHSTIGRVERGKTKYDEGLLLALSDALSTSPAALLSINPLAPENTFALEAEKLTEDQRRRAAALIRAFREQDTAA